MDDGDGDVKSIDHRLGWHYPTCEKACSDLVGLVSDVKEGNPLESRKSPGRCVRVASHGLVEDDLGGE